jgi:hypothetical protein
VDVFRATQRRRLACIALGSVLAVGFVACSSSPRAAVPEASPGEVTSIAVAGPTRASEIAPTEATTVASVPESSGQRGVAANAAEQRWVRIEANLFVDSVDSVLDTVRRAKDAGANTVMFSDTKLNLWFGDEKLGAQWRPLMKQVADGVRAEGMKLVLQTVPVGYCTPVLFHDPNLTTGYPIIDQPMVVRGGVLVPEQTAVIANGSFEQATDNTPSDWGFQDEAGVHTFIDSTIAKDGRNSMRFVGSGASNDNARIFTSVAVKPNQQYTLRFWAKAEGLTADYLGPVVTSDDEQRQLTAQHYSFDSLDGRQYVTQPNDLTSDWTEMAMAFNSGNETTVRLGFGSWTTAAGTLWVDDVRLEATPLLNIIRRDSLPLTIKTSTGRALSEGIDLTPAIDEQLGRIGYTGNFDTYHSEPVVKLLDQSTLREGERVLVSGYHALVTTGGQVGCSWHDPGVFAVMKQVHEQAELAFGADGYLVDVEEVRTGGWEPSDAAFVSAGAALGAHTQRVIDDARAATGKPIYIWSDMFDPTANAVESYYAVASSMSESWKALDPKSAIIVNWTAANEGTRGMASVDHFAQLGFTQIAAGYYDLDVAENFQSWSVALVDQPGIVGSMYTTFMADYSQIMAFGRLWWR